jgi:hypothetical protein
MLLGNRGEPLKVVCGQQAGFVDQQHPSRGLCL